MRHFNKFLCIHNFCLSVNVSVVAVIKEASSLFVIWNFFGPVLRNFFSRLQLIWRFWGLVVAFFFVFRIDWSFWNFCLFSLRVWNYPSVELIQKLKWDYIWSDSMESILWIKIEISSKKCVPGRISKNDLVQSIPDILKNAYTKGV